MSHYLLGVILPKEVKPTEGKTKCYIGEVMERYNENREVEAYERDCACGDWKASLLADKLATERTGLTWKGLREEFNRKPQTERSEAVWQEVRRPLMEATDTARAELDAKPDPDCSECHGSGHYPSTYNPDSKWDWYRIGGRWDGEIAGSPAETSDNGFNFSREHERLENNITTVEAIAAEPFAVLTPDGEWHEQGKMGWWGMVTEENHQYEQDLAQLREKYASHYIVAVDCHI